MSIWHTKEELEEMIEYIEKEMPTLEEGKKIYQDMLRDLPAHEEKKKQQLELFSQICPDRCGQIDFENNTVVYDEEHYTEWLTNLWIYPIRDHIKIFDIVGLDYEVRIADIYDISKAFSVYYANTESDQFKFRVAMKLSRLYAEYYQNLLEETGIYESFIRVYVYNHPWTGCEKEIAPDRYSDSNTLISEAEAEEIMKGLYPKACEIVGNPPIDELNFESVTSNSKKKLCRARLDKEHFEIYSKNGFNISNISISAEKFQQGHEVKIENGREIYYLEFEVDLGN